MAGYYLSYVFRTINTLISGQLSADLGLDAANLGLLTSVFFLVFAGVQIPVGTLLDRFGPRRVQSVLLMIAGSGAALFGASSGFLELLVARAMIGIGVSAAAMAGLKAIVTWFPRERIALVNGYMMMLGALGAVTATTPAQWLLEYTGWRGLFELLALATFASALLIYWMVPDATPSQLTQPTAIKLSAIYTDRRFWRIAPLSASCIGSAWSLQALWAAPWMMNVEGLNRESSITHLFMMALGISDSKALERLDGAVVRILSGALELPPADRPRDALRMLGLEKFAPPILLSGRLDFDTAELSATAPLYFGIPPAEATRLRFRGQPRYVLTIENFASFHRHVAEADPQRSGVTIYVGGYPSLATQDALKALAASLPAGVPFFHWSDIDPDGVWIFRTIESSLARELHPHLMSVAIAKKLGKPPAERVRLPSDIGSSAISDLAAYLRQPGANWLEQEELDPTPPEVQDT